MKEKTVLPYEAVRMEILSFYEVDIITTSNNIEEDLGENDGEWT